MKGLIAGELRLTIDIILGMMAGEVIMRMDLARKFMARLLPKNIPAVTALALMTSFGSSKTGAAILASALEGSTITEREAIYSVLMLALPSYLRRWPATLAMSAGMAGKAGVIFALSLLARSILRFVWVYMLLRGNYRRQELSVNEVSCSGGIVRRLIKSLPLAWIFFAMAYLLAPVADDFFKEHFSGLGLPLSGWTVAASSIAHVSSALAMAGGAMTRGELSEAQAVFALVLGSGLGTATRILRQNAGYYFGLFNPKTAQKMLIMNFITIMPLIMLNILLASLAL